MISRSVISSSKSRSTTSVGALPAPAASAAAFVSAACLPSAMRCCRTACAAARFSARCSSVIASHARCVASRDAWRDAFRAAFSACFLTTRLAANFSDLRCRFCAFFEANGPCSASYAAMAAASAAFRSSAAARSAAAAAAASAGAASAAASAAEGPASVKSIDVSFTSSLSSPGGDRTSHQAKIGSDLRLCARTYCERLGAGCAATHRLTPSLSRRSSTCNVRYSASARWTAGLRSSHSAATRSSSSACAAAPTARAFSPSSASKSAVLAASCSSSA